MSGATMTPEELRALDVRVGKASGLWVCQNCNDACRHARRSDGTHVLLPHYSSDPVASRVLLDEMAADEDLIVSIAVGLDGGMAEVELLHVERARALFRESLDAAICLAWLAWKAQG